MSDASQNTSSSLREVLILGVQGSGKTTLLTVLGHRFKKSGIFGLGMTSVHGTHTLRFVDGLWHSMTMPLPDRFFPPATDPSSAVYLSWDVNAGTTPLFRLSTFDFAGEAICRVFASSSSSDEDFAWETEDQLRQMAERASVFCLFVRPADLESGSAKHPDAPAAVRDRSRKTVETLLAVANGEAGEGKGLLFVLTDAQTYAADIERAGGPKAWLFAEIPELERSPRAVAADVISTVAVRETIPTSKGTEVPADNFSSEGLESFLLAVGGLVAEDLMPIGKAILALRDAECAYSEAKAHPSLKRPFERIEAGRRFAECGRWFRTKADALLDRFGPGPAIREVSEQFVTGQIEESLRAVALEQALEQRLRRMAESQVSTPPSWEDFRKGVFDDAQRNCPSDRPFDESDLPTAADWFNAAFANARGRIKTEKSELLMRRKRSIRRCCAMAVVLTVAALSGFCYWNHERTTEQKRLRRSWPGEGKETTYPHVLTGPTYDDGYVAMPGWELDNPHKPRNVTWLPGWKPAQNAKIQAGRKPDEWVCDPGYERKSKQPVKTVDALAVRWSENLRHPSVKNIHSAAKEGDWNPDPGYVSRSGMSALAGVEWRSGLEHPKYHGAISSQKEGLWDGKPGWKVSDPKRPETVKWVPGTKWPGDKTRPANAHIVAAATASGVWLPAPGYTWIDKTDGWKGVKWDPNRPGSNWYAPGSMNKLSPHVKTGTKKGEWIADPGYVLDDASDPATLHWKAGIPHPQNKHLVSDSEADQWKGASTGWVWTGGNNAKWQSGIPHPKHPHVETSSEEGRFLPEAGYAWVDKDNSWEVKWVPGQKHPHHLHVVAAPVSVHGSEGGWWPEDGYAWNKTDENGRGILNAGVHWSPRILARDNPKRRAAKTEGKWEVECSTCSGSGRARTKVSCPDCQGKGSIRTNTSCSSCQGTGKRDQRISENCNSCILGRKPCPKIGKLGFEVRNLGVFNNVTYGLKHVFIRVPSCIGCGGTGRNPYNDLLNCAACHGYGYIWELCLTCEGTGFIPCSDCGGTGSISKTIRTDCDKCGGSGRAFRSETCNKCKGSGTVPEFASCSSCSGSGWRPE